MSASPVVQTWSHLLLAASWQAAVLALLVLLCERMHWLRSPRMRHTLWWFVLLAPLALAPARLLLSQHHAVMRLPAPAAVTRVTEVVAAPPPLPLSAPVVPVTPGPPPAPARPFPWRAVLFTGWLLGCAAMALRLVVGHWRVRLMLRESAPVEAGTARTLLDELCTHADVRAALRQSATVGAAMLCGLRRPTIIAPREWLTDFAPTELRALLAHEVAHLRRRDLVAMLAQRVVEIPLFFHPAVWAAARFLAAAREELCDAWAIAQGADPAEYARCLTRAAARAQTRFPLASVGLTEGKSRLRQRVEAIMSGRQAGVMTRRLAIALGVGLVLCAVAFAGVQLRAPRPARKPSMGSAAPSAPTASGETLEVVPSQPSPEARETEAALQQLGLETQKLTYRAPFAHQVQVLVEQYERGSVVQKIDLSTGTDAGEYTLLLFKRKQGDALTFSCGLLSKGSASMSSRDQAVSLKGYQSSGSVTQTPASLSVGVRTPIWYFHADRRGTEASLTPSSEKDIPRFAAEHDLALVAYVTITRAAERLAAEPDPGKGQATLDLTVLSRDGKPVPGATITLQVQTTMQVFEHGEPAPRTGTRPYDLYRALGKTDQHGKATVTIPPLGPSTPLLAVTYHDPRTGKDLTAKRLLALQPGTRTSATITIPSEATPTIRSAPATASSPPPQADSALLDLTVVRADGQPAAGAALTVEGRMPWEGPRWQGEADAHGKATVVIDHPAPGTRPLRVSYRNPARAGKELTAVRLLILSPGTRTSATITVPSGGTEHIESAPRTAEEAAARAQRDAAWAALQAQQKAKEAQEKAYWQRRRAEVAALSPAARRAEVAKVQARLHQLKAKARPLEAQAAELDQLGRGVVNRLREIEAESPGAQTPEGTALTDRFNKITAEQSTVGQQLQPLLDQRTAAERELTLLQQAKDT
jgi:beta-lactamase regulating signal transducer with metallopeptidase domain